MADDFQPDDFRPDDFQPDAGALPSYGQAATSQAQADIPKPSLKVSGDNAVDRAGLRAWLKLGETIKGIPESLPPVMAYRGIQQGISGVKQFRDVMKKKGFVGALMTPPANDLSLSEVAGQALGLNTEAIKEDVQAGNYAGVAGEAGSTILLNLLMGKAMKGVLPKTVAGEANQERMVNRLTFAGMARAAKPGESGFNVKIKQVLPDLIEQARKTPANLTGLDLFSKIVRDNIGAKEKVFTDFLAQPEPTAKPGTLQLPPAKTPIETGVQQVVGDGVEYKLTNPAIMMMDQTKVSGQLSKLQSIMADKEQFGSFSPSEQQTIREQIGRLKSVSNDMKQPAMARTFGARQADGSPIASAIEQQITSDMEKTDPSMAQALREEASVFRNNFTLNELNNMRKVRNALLDPFYNKSELAQGVDIKKFAAQKLAAKVADDKIRDILYSAMEDKGLTGVRELKQKQGSLMEILDQVEGKRQRIPEMASFQKGQPILNRLRGGSLYATTGGSEGLRLSHVVDVFSPEAVSKQRAINAAVKRSIGTKPNKYGPVVGSLVNALIQRGGGQ